MKVAQIAKSSHNIGEGALINGFQSAFKKDFNGDIHFTCIDRKLFQSIQGLEFDSGSIQLVFDDNYASYLSNTFDLLVIGGGGILQTGLYENLGGLVLAGTLSSLKSLSIPWVIYAAGDNRFSSSDPFNYANEFTQLVDISSRCNSLVSMRNDLSKERFSDILPEYILDQISTIPDPGLYVSTSKLPNPLIIRGKRNIIIQLAGDRLSKRFSSILPNAVNVFLEALSSVCLDLANEFDVNYILAPHIPADFPLITQFLEICTQKSFKGSGFVRECFDISCCTRGFSRAPYFFSMYEQADLAIGMRGHAAICSVGLSTPFISLNTHPKVSGFLDSMGLSDYIVDPFYPDFKSSLSSLCSLLLNDSSLWYSIRDMSYSKCQITTSEFHQRILSML